MTADFKDFQKNIDEKINEIVQQITKKIDDFLDTDNSTLEYIECGKIFLHFKKHVDKFLSEYCQQYAIQEALREVYLKKGWSIKYEYRWYYGLPLKDKTIGINFFKCTKVS